MLTALILGGIATFVISEIIRFVILHWRVIVGWFQKWLNRHENVDKDAIGFTISESAEAGNYILVQGIFNKESNSVEEARRITAEDVEEEVKHNCFREKLTLFT